MTILAFPDTTGKPTDGSFTYEANGVIYSWTGDYWAANNAQGFDQRYVNADGDQMTGDLTVPSLNGGPLAGLRNVLINGNFKIMQRENASQNVETTGNSGYTMDRWITDSACTTARRLMGDGTPVAEIYCSKPTYMLQGVELYKSAVPSAGVSDLPFKQGSTWTLSYYCDSAPTSVGQIVEFRNNANDGTASANPQAVTGVPLPTPTGESIGTLTRYSTTFTINAQPAGDSTCLVFHISGESTSVNRFAFAQLEPGDQVTPFEHRPIALERQLCERYYYKAPDGIWRLYQSGASRMQANLWFPTTMRATPTCQLFNVQASGSVTSVTANDPTPRGFLAVCNPNNSTLPGTTEAYAGTYSGDAEL